MTAEVPVNSNENCKDEIKRTNHISSAHVSKLNTKSETENLTCPREGQRVWKEAVFIASENCFLFLCTRRFEVANGVDPLRQACTKLAESPTAAYF